MTARNHKENPAHLTCGIAMRAIRSAPISVIGPPRTPAAANCCFETLARFCITTEETPGDEKNALLPISEIRQRCHVGDRVLLVDARELMRGNFSAFCKPAYHEF